MLAQSQGTASALRLSGRTARRSPRHELYGAPGPGVRGKASYPTSDSRLGRIVRTTLGHDRQHFARVHRLAFRNEQSSQSVPVFGERTSFCIFIASTTTIPWPASICFSRFRPARESLSRASARALAGGPRIASAAPRFRRHSRGSRTVAEYSRPATDDRADRARALHPGFERPPADENRISAGRDFDGVGFDARRPSIEHSECRRRVRASKFDRSRFAGEFDCEFHAAFIARVAARGPAARAAPRFSSATRARRACRRSFLLGAVPRDVPQSGGQDGGILRVLSALQPARCALAAGEAREKIIQPACVDIAILKIRRRPECGEKVPTFVLIPLA